MALEVLWCRMCARYSLIRMLKPRPVWLYTLSYLLQGLWYKALLLLFSRVFLLCIILHTFQRMCWRFFFFPALPKYLPIALETLRNGNPKKSEAGAGSELRKFSVLCLGFRKKLLGRVPFRWWIGYIGNLCPKEFRTANPPALRGKKQLQPQIAFYYCGRCNEIMSGNRL